MRKKKQYVDIVVTWKPSTDPNATPGEPDPELIRDLARELGRMAARYAMAEARQRAVNASKEYPSDLGKTSPDVVE